MRAEKKEGSVGKQLSKRLVLVILHIKGEVDNELNPESWTKNFRGFIMPK